MKEIKDLKIGDEVGIITGMHDCVSLGEVVRTTKTMIMVVHKGQQYENKFRKSDGYSTASGSFHRTCIEPFTEEMRVAIKADNLKHKVRRLCETIGKFPEAVTQQEAEQLEVITTRIKDR